jgi:hypothetical protein
MNEEIIDKNRVVKLSIEFSLDIIKFCEKLEQQKNLYLQDSY